MKNKIIVISFCLIASAFPKIVIGQNVFNVGIGSFVGIGTLAPAVQLDLWPLGLNNAYGLNGITVMQNWGTRNMFTGVGTGASLTTGTDNVFNGFNAGRANANGSFNTFIGSDAGTTNVSGSNNAKPTNQQPNSCYCYRSRCLCSWWKFN